MSIDISQIIRNQKLGKGPSVEEVAILVAEVERLRGALEWYADNQYGNVQFDPPIPDIPILYDQGERARQTLEGVNMDAES